MQKKLIVISILSFFFAVSLGSANSSWSITDVDGAKSPMNLSDNTQSVQIIELVDGQGDPVNKSRLDDAEDWSLNYNYSETPNSKGDMQHLEGSYYYANFTAYNSSSSIEYELFDESPSSGEINLTETLNFDNLTVDVQTMFSKLKAGDKKLYEVDVTDENSGTSGDEAEVYITITNGSEYKEVELGYNNGLYTNSIETPEYLNSNVAIHAYAISSDNPVKTGSESYLSEVFPDNKIDYLDSDSGCNNESFFESCERGADIETGFNATPFAASNVDLHLKKDEKNGALKDFKEISMEKYDGLWNANYTVPDINTSKYNKKLVTQYNATIDNKTYVKTRNITYKSFDIKDRSEVTAFKGTDYELKVLFGKYHSLSFLNDSRIKSGNVSIYKEDDSLFENFSLSEMDYNSNTGLYQKTVDIPTGADKGNYDTEIKGTNIYGDTKEKDSGFSVESVDASFNVSETDLEYDYNSTGNKKESINITNRLSEPIEIEANFSSDLNNISTFNGNESLTLDGSETKNASLEFELFEARDREGKMTLTGNNTNYSTTLDIDINGVDCEIVNGSICIDRNKWINLTSTEVGSTVKTVTVQNLRDESPRVNVFISGEVSDYLKANPSSDIVFSTRDFDLNYTPRRIGTFNGEIEFEGPDGSITLKTKYESEVENLQPSISTDSFLSISVISGQSVDKSITVTNTGNVDVNSLSATSESFGSVSIEDVSIPAGEEKEVKLTLDDIENSAGSVEVIGSTDNGDAESSITVTVSFINYEQKIEDLNDRIKDLQGEAESEEIQGRLSDLSLDVSEAESLYQKGDVQEAENLYSNIQQDLDDVESEISQNGGSIGGNNGGSENVTDSEGGENSGGGVGGILIALFVLILLISVVGFVIYTSYIPEPGDPLYDILGEENGNRS